MKKFLKPLIIATSVACVAGIGAVSFAKWENGGPDPIKGMTGTVDTVNVTASTNLASGDTLVPYDQQGATATQKTYLEITLDEKLSGNGGTVSVSYKIKQGTVASDALGVGKLYYKVASSYTAPTSDTDGTWTELSESDAPLTFTDIDTKKVYVVLMSDDEKNDMGKNFNVTITATFA